ncbi:DNA-binding response OmpR family regulator [Lysinibacillus composti]|uniref:DNA-binding response regulator n=1 Tax=Lysinibacillus composti TaxID=720633 RepID=A0A3N9UTD7_9BACI|nr:response regulator transcription factor [Lysinibacillus composti]MBM7607735.1 DNA-binding response OmpR family regulator [Lysinibacillus composti]RQW75772.1 DNA-binding response regulator [Lysinibacillus composti]
MKKVLIIEDEKDLSEFIRLELEYEGYKVLTSYNGRDGVDQALNENVDLILLDLMLPGLNGVEVCRRIRLASNTPIIMITARDNVFDKISGLDSGADDYLTKPFQIEELLARMRSIFRRVENTLSQQTLVHKQLQLNIESRILKRGNEELELTKKEFDLLYLLMKNKNKVLTRESLLEKVWGFETNVETNVVDVYISYLRAKIDKKEEDSYIQTVRGTGYVMRD